MRSVPVLTKSEKCVKQMKKYIWHLQEKTSDDDEEGPSFIECVLANDKKLRWCEKSLSKMFVRKL